MENPLAVLSRAFQEAADALDQVEMNVDAVAALIGGNGAARRKPLLRPIPGKKIVTVRSYRRSPLVKAFKAHRPTAKAPWAKPAKRKIRLSPKRMAELVLQGRYAGRIKQLPSGDQKLVREMRASKGVRPAIALASDLLQKLPPTPKKKRR